MRKGELPDVSHPSVSNSHSENCQECQGNADALWRFLAALGERDAVCSAEYHESSSPKTASASTSTKRTPSVT